jgi:hypothetical protein
LLKERATSSDQYEDEVAPEGIREYVTFLKEGIPVA